LTLHLRINIKAQPRKYACEHGNSTWYNSERIYKICYF